MGGLEGMLNTVELPAFEELIYGESPDYSALECAARAVFEIDEEAAVTVTAAGRYKGYTSIARVEVDIAGEQKVMYIKREKTNALSAAVQIELNNLLRDNPLNYAVSLTEEGNNCTVLEEVPGVDLNTLERYQRENIYRSTEFAYAYGSWLEGALLIGLCDRDWRNVLWDGFSLNDLDFGWGFGMLLRHPPEGNYDSGGSLYRLRNIRFDLLKSDLIERGRKDMRYKIAENLSKNAKAIYLLCTAYDTSEEGKGKKHGPREVLLHYASNLNEPKLRKLFKHILAR